MNTSSVSSVSQFQSSASLSHRIAKVAGRLAPGERAVADYLRDHPEEAAVSSASRLGAETNTSDATVIRTARKLGFDGLSDLKRSLVDHVARRRDPAKVLDERLRRLPEGAGTVVGPVLDAGRALLGEADDLVDGDEWQRCGAALTAATHVWTYGIGPSAMLAEYFALALRRAGAAADAWTATGFRLADDLLRVEAGHAVVVIAPLRVFRETGIVLDRAHQVGATSIVLTEAIEEAGDTQADHVLHLPESTASAANELLVPLTLLHGLVLELVAKDRSTAIRNHQELNALRTKIAGNELDTTSLRGPYSV
ncbi:DNA-binding MurR/RpiR family transcriptional regulator [Rhodococcus opacus]|nr:DNA-binding MurR/RpiR family transcriptional regulator [Rhodococcus opacus]